MLKNLQNILQILYKHWFLPVDFEPVFGNQVHVGILDFYKILKANQISYQNICCCPSLNQMKLQFILKYNFFSDVYFRSYTIK